MSMHYLDGEPVDHADLIDWLGWCPKNQKPRRIKKWVNQARRMMRHCDHDWRRTQERIMGHESQVCCKCRSGLILNPNNDL